ncbi:MAG: GDP-mannose 4,6-dehydratase [Anaerolineales bacterium]|nr:GDP-mannose 4,6-dehydratase [Chloroflexota bacterium]MBL6982298.1 GDP-mannose 4,6-dehydratase [Anaerolineales bacterium]
MRVLLVGVAGFIGSHLADRLLNNDHQVIGVDNFNTGRRENLAQVHEHPEFQLIEHDIVESFNLDKPVDWVMHFASPTGPGKFMEYPIQTLRVNSEGTRCLLELAHRYNAKFFLASTGKVYGDPDLHPQSESYFGNVNPNSPRSVYDEAKRFAESLTQAYHRKFGLDVRIARIFNTYGPRMYSNNGCVIIKFITQAINGQPITVYGNGSQTRSFQFVDDLIDGILSLMNVKFHKPVNLGCPEERQILELAYLIRKLTRSASEIQYLPLPKDEPQTRCPDITLAKKLLEWDPQVDFLTGLRQTLDHVQSQTAANSTVMIDA